MVSRTVGSTGIALKRSSRNVPSIRASRGNIAGLRIVWFRARIGALNPVMTADGNMKSWASFKMTIGSKTTINKR